MTSKTVSNPWKELAPSSWTIVSACNKSGLARIDYTCDPTSSSYNEFGAYCSDWNNANYMNGLTAGCIFLWCKKFYSGNYASTFASSNTIASIYSGSGSSSDNSMTPALTTTNLVYYSPPWGSGTALGFVAKDDAIVFTCAHVGSAAYYTPSKRNIFCEGGAKMTFNVTVY